MKHIKLCTALLLTALLSTAASPAYAATDSFGNEVDWEEGYGYEDGAGSEKLEEKEQKSEEGSTEYSFSEQVKVLEQMQQYETSAPEETGYISAALTIPDKEWSESNIRVTLYDGGRKEELWLYRQSGWSGRAEIPVGHDTIGKAESADENYEFTVSPSTFDLVENGTVALDLTLGTSKPQVVIPDGLATAADAENPAPPQEDAKSAIPYAVVIVAVVLVLLIVAVVSVIKVRKERKDGYRNNLFD